ncbi:EamA family transporter [Winogradskyella eckloniae]|uniref:DMT family transporter n=1 Tax=Winogradskyella eckloniae TaxID=1089306 RepID=UPI00156645EA|nr:DMT family transporter [Winogradskyella eckloniae]NRD18819.1 EamA family transporter [Winogradskyella eckloniae]
MRDKSHINNLFILIIATICLSTSGPLGKFIDMPTGVIIWWRSILAAILIFIFCLIKGISLKINTKKDRITFVIAAILMGAHWITYFLALKRSNVAVGMISLFTFPVIIALLEPFFSKTKLDPIHIILGVMVLLGIYFLAPEFDFQNNYLQGILFGLISAVCYAIRILMLKEQVARYNATMLMFYQVIIVSVLLFPVLFFMDTSHIATQYPYIILLAIVTTVIGHTLFVNSLQYFKASTASIIGSTQPVFGIIIAFFFLNEIPTLHTFVGGALILATVIIESVRSKKQ